jgi:DNA-binding transcriptional LysR family regulator
MKLHQLIYFLETAKQEHIGRAAKILAISPSAISHSVAALEEELGRQLFARQGKNIFLTNHGKLLFERTSKLLLDIVAIKEEIISDQVELQGTYKLAGSHLLCPELLSPAWVKIQTKNPKLFAELYTLRSALVVKGISSGEYDFGICFSPQSHPTIHIKPIYEGQLVISLRKGHPLLKKPKADQLRLLAPYPATLPKSYQGIDNCETHPIFEKFNIVPKVDLVFDNYEVAIGKVRHSDAWTFLPDWVATNAGLTTIVPAEGWNAPVNISALWPKNRILTRVLSHLVDGLVDEIKNRKHSH